MCPEMVVVPRGTFTMGAPPKEADRDADEGPQHRITIARPFAVGRFAVTFDEWDACAAGGGCNRYWPDDRGWGRGRLPVIGINWNDAKAYVDWLSRKTGRTYRLLSESEREYVARAGTATPFWFGRTVSPQQANYNSTFPYANGPRGEPRRKTVSVDTFPPNGSGSIRCTAMSGNGSRTAIGRATRMSRRMDQHTQARNAASVSCAAAPGTALPGSFARRIASAPTR